MIINRLRRLTLTALILVVIMLVFIPGCKPKTETTQLSVFVAGSLVVPFAEIEQAYEDMHPDVDVQIEAHGSIQVIRHVTEIHDLIDVIIPADYSLIPLLMYNSLIPETDLPYADWTVQWASNRVVLAFTPQSLYADEIDSHNWVEIIARPDVLFGISDPRLDAAGYRTLMIGQLAESVYGNPTIFEEIFLGAFSQPIIAQKKSNQHIILVPEILETTDSSNIIMRSGSVALLALLESGDIDYAFEYESVARQHGLNFVELPVEINLGDPNHAADYGAVEVRLDFQRFASVTPVFDGEVIGYGITIPANAPNPESALDFVEFLLGPQGGSIMDGNSHSVFTTPVVDNYQALPDRLKSIIDPGE